MSVLATWAAIGRVTGLSWWIVEGEEKEEMVVKGRRIYFSDSFLE